MSTKLNQQEIIPLPSDVGALGNRINKETRSAHNKIDKLMTLKFALAVRDAKIYRQGLQSFYHVFKTIEDCLHYQISLNTEWSDVFTKIWKPEIARSEKMFQDLMFYYKDEPAKFSSPIMEEQIKFVNHIKAVTSEKPYLLLAYLHVMYLALFAGGRILRSSLSKATRMFPQIDGLTHEEIVSRGTNFFRFDVEDENILRLIYKRDYEIVTRAKLTEAQKQDIISESNYIFEQNGRCVKEIESYNLTRIQKKWAYIIATKGYYVLIAVLFFIMLLTVQRIVLHLIF